MFRGSVNIKKIMRFYIENQFHKTFMIATYVRSIIVVEDKIKNALAVVEMLDLLQDPFLVKSGGHITITISQV